MDLKVKIGDVTFKNPVWVASGCFGYGEEFSDFIDLNEVGAIVTKTVTPEAREGNPTPRIVETPSGLLNSIGLENKGIDHLIKNYLPRLRKLNTKTVVSIAGNGEKEFIICAEKLSGKNEPDAIEVNLSCPNVSHKETKYALIAQDAKSTEKIISAIRSRTKCPIIAKLTPNVTDIAEIAKAAEGGGAHAVSLVNTYMAMAVDAENMKPVLGNIVGGLSGPAIKPMALKAVRDVYNGVKIPVVGIGGVMTGIDIAEFMLCGATAVQTGTSNLVDPVSYNRILKEFKDYLRKKKKSAKSIIGKLKS